MRGSSSSSACENSGIWLLAALLASACATASTSQQTELLRQAFLELNGRQVLNCLGPPSDFDYPDEHRARWVYIHALPDLDARPFGSAVPRTFLSPKVRRFLADPLNADLAPGFCRLTIQMVDGQVTDLAAEGRSSLGMRSTSQCHYRAALCLERPESGRHPPRARAASLLGRPAQVRWAR